jgi:pyruvate/2-oxoglutarate/acetoin dehydrogenase E1 component
LPWDVDTVVESVKKTGRLVIVHEAGMTAGVGAEISAEVQKRCFLKLSAPVKRVTGWEYVSCLFHVMQRLILCATAFLMLSNMKNSIYQTPSEFSMLSWRHYHTDSNTQHPFN